MFLSRTVLVPGDPLRDFLYAWDRDGVPPVSTTLPGDPVAVGANSAPTAPYAVGWKVSRDCPPGTYFVYNTPVEIVPAPRPPDADWIRPDTTRISAEYVQRAIDRSKGTVAFLPGNYYFDRALDLSERPGLRLVGHGARVTRLWGDPNEFGQPVFRGGAHCSVEGFELSAVSDDGLVFHSPEFVDGLCLKDCAVRRGTFGYAYRRCTFDGCTFDGGGMVLGAPHGLYRRCTWTRNATAHAFKTGGPCVGGLAMIDCLFDDTDRGPAFDCTVGPVSDNIFVGTRLRNIQRDQNGNESFGLESRGPANGFDRNLVIGTRVNDCDGNFFLPWDAPARNNSILDTVVKGGGGFWLAGVDDVEQSGNVYGQWELHDTDGIRLGWRDGHGRRHGLGIAGNVFRNGAVLGFRPARLNQGVYAAATYARKGWFDKVACGPGNRFETVSWRMDQFAVEIEREVVSATEAA